MGKQYNDPTVVKDTLRLMISLKCNFKCWYCCNEQDQFNSLFQYHSVEEIDFSGYRNFCLSGGEPFAHKELLYRLISYIPEDRNVFIYTNGSLIEEEDLDILKTFPHVKCLNITLHGVAMLDKMLPEIENRFPVRFSFQDTLEEKMVEKYGNRLGNYKLWHMNYCYVPNEDWVVLQEAPSFEKAFTWDGILPLTN
ncbi:radical SAM protein [Candidatus Bathyarchaeota archaeon]|nr:radical SAM protein [Candidatus Bathyarchaeota archaeon]